MERAVEVSHGNGDGVETEEGFVEIVGSGLKAVRPRLPNGLIDWEHTYYRREALVNAERDPKKQE